MMITVLFVLFVIMILLGGPIAAAMGFPSIIALIVDGSKLTAVPVNLYGQMCKFVLLAIPFFILGGNVMEKAGISERLIQFCQSLVGHIRGGLAVVCVLVSCFFAAISGSGPATVAALGIIVIPAMTRVGYPVGAAAALMAVAGAIGVIIPPSIPFVNYSAITGESTGEMFIAGIIPGCLMGLALIVAMYFVMRGKPLQKLPRASLKECWRSFLSAFWGLLMPVIILGGIYGGIFTPTEAAAVAAVYGMFVGFFIYRTLKLSDMADIFKRSAKQSGAVMITVGLASLMAYLLTIQGVTNSIVTWIINVSNGHVVIFLLIVNITLLIAGCVIDGVAAIYLFTPLFYPVALAMGYDTVALGVIIVMNLAIGLATPPVGINLYVASSISKTPPRNIIKYMWPFITASVLVLLLLTYCPSIVTWLPNLLMK